MSQVRSAISRAVSGVASSHSRLTTCSSKVCSWSAGSPGASRGSGSPTASFHIAVATRSRLRSVIWSIRDLHAKQCATERGHNHTPGCYGRVMQDDPSGAGREDEDRDAAKSSQEGSSEQQGYEGAGVEEGGGYQRSAEGGGGYERSGSEDEDYDPRREGDGEG